MDDDPQDPSRGPKAFQSVEKDTQSLAQRLAELMRALATERLRAEGLQKATKVSSCDACTIAMGFVIGLPCSVAVGERFTPEGFQGGQGRQNGCYLHSILPCTGPGRYIGILKAAYRGAKEGRQGSSCQLLALTLASALPIP